MERRANNTGSVVRRKDGRWHGSIQINGVRRTVYGKTKGEASKKIDQLRADANKAGGLPNPGNRTVNDLLDSWIEASSSTLKSRTIEHYVAVSNHHIRPTIGSFRLSRIAPYNMQNLYISLERDGLSRIPSQVHAILHRAFKLAVLWRWVSENPCDRVVRPIHKAPTKAMWNEAQTEQFTDGIREHWLGPLWIMLLGTGCRLGEALSLSWTDIEGDTVSFRHTLQRINGEWQIGSTKTEAGKREVRLPSAVIDVLKRQSAQQAEWRLKAGSEWPDTGLVFTNRDGNPIHRAVVAHAMAKVCKRLSLPPLTPHGLRHQSASMLIAKGIPLPAVSKRLGHSRTSITLDIYSHVIGGEDVAAADVLDKAMNGSV